MSDKAHYFRENTHVIRTIGDGDVHAVRNQCGESPLPLEFSTIDGAQLRCSWHGCVYDIRSGRRVDRADGERLQVFPVLVKDGRIEVAIDVEPAGKVL